MPRLGQWGRVMSRGLFRLRAHALAFELARTIPTRDVIADLVAVTVRIARHGGLSDRELVCVAMKAIRAEPLEHDVQHVAEPPAAEPPAA